MKEGDKLVNNSQYFQITGINKLDNIADSIEIGNESTDDDDEDEHVGDIEDDIIVSPRFQVRRKSTASLITRPPSAISRKGSIASISSLTSNLDLEARDDIVRLTVKANTKRASSKRKDVEEDSRTDMVNVPIIVVTIPHEEDCEDSNWSNDYRNFKFQLKKSLKEKEARLEKQILRERRQRRGSLGSTVSVDSLNATEIVQKKRIKQMKRRKSNLKRHANKVTPS